MEIQQIMNLKNLYFSWLLQWARLKRLLGGAAEAVILLAA